MKLEQEISEYYESILAMSDTVRTMYVMAIEVLNSGSKERALAIVELDEYVNNYNEAINDKAIEILALLAPVASDLRMILAGIKMSTDLERIGDYAKAIGRYVIKNEKMDERLAPYVNPIGNQFIGFFDKAMLAFKEKDIKAALSLPSQDDIIDSEFKKLLHFIETLHNKGEIITHLVPTIGMLRNIERAGDHTKNICEHIIYEVKGQHYDFG